ncbi:AAA family ATPase [Streptomyces geranii]|uniref:AAA family ATPase n=1 Tax=Streptomyces geranii TaxID=2058923 RepID=UPI0013008DAE|nr:AAA family ATPase [Streptomyces geranii]
MPGMLRLSRLNLLFGMNNSGKTKLLHLLRSLSSPHLLMDFPVDLSCAITWFDPELRKALVDVRGRWLEYRVDDRRVALPPRPYRVLSFGPEAYKERFFPLKSPSIQGIAKFLGVDRWTARTVIVNMPALLPDVMSEVAFYGDDVKVSYREGVIGGKELGQVAVWFYALAVFAELQARAEPTILVLDEPFVFLHPAAQRHVLELFESATWTFQVILAEHSLTAYERRHHGWSATVLVPEGERQSRISQEDADLESIGGG